MPEAGYKRCNRCGEVKPITGFSTNRGMADGRLNQCKQCVARKTKAHYEANKEKYSRKSALWRESHSEQVREKHREWHVNNRDRSRATRRRYEQRNRDKRRAHGAVYRALKSGQLSKPDRCEDCGKEVASLDLHAHHDDYSKPLEVAWICRWCHVKVGLSNDAGEP